MFPIALEKTWKMQRWCLQVFQFLLLVMEVNIKLANGQLFGREETSRIGFRKNMAKALIFNKYIEEKKVAGSKRKLPRWQDLLHVLTRLEPYTNFDSAGCIVPCATRSVQRRCKCDRHCNTYCKCSLGINHHLESLNYTLFSD